MNAKSVSLHSDFPQKVWVVIEQPRDEPYRMDYDPIQDSFSRSHYRSLFYERGFSGAYGWVGGLGTPPHAHFDVILITKQNPQVGEVILGHICGIFRRGDGDHKLVALDANLLETVSDPDIYKLDQATYTELMRLYPEIGEGEGWFGPENAYSFLREGTPTHI